MDTAFLIVSMLQAFTWLDESLRNYLREQGWQSVTRPQAMVMMAVVRGVRRPSEIARILGVSRQAVHTTIIGMARLGLLELASDPDDGRSKIVVITEHGRGVSEHARAATQAMAKELEHRIGLSNLEALLRALAADWGPPMDRFDAVR